MNGERKCEMTVLIDNYDKKRFVALISRAAFASHQTKWQQPGLCFSVFPSFSLSRQLIFFYNPSFFHVPCSARFGKILIPVFCASKSTCKARAKILCVIPLHRIQT